MLNTIAQSLIIHLRYYLLCFGSISQSSLIVREYCVFLETNPSATKYIYIRQINCEWKEVPMNTLSTRHKHEDHSSDYEGLANLIYLFQALAFLLGGITFVIAVVLGYLNQHHVKGIWLESHYKWQINTFWVALALVVIGTATFPYIIGVVVLIAATIWVIYRIAYGWICFLYSGCSITTSTIDSR